MDRLTIKQEKFCLKFIETGNASEAYRQSYNCEKMKPETIKRKAKELIDNGNITATIDRLRAEVVERSIVDATYVLNRHVEIDRMSISDILNDDWTLKPLNEWPEVWCSFLSAVDVVELRAGHDSPEAATALLKKIKWPNKLKNLELLGKHVAVQAYKEKAEVEVINPPVLNVTLQGEMSPGSKLSTFITSKGDE